MLVATSMAARDASAGALPAVSGYAFRTLPKKLRLPKAPTNTATRTTRVLLVSPWAGKRTSLLLRELSGTALPSSCQYQAPHDQYIDETDQHGGAADVLGALGEVVVVQRDAIHGGLDG